MAEEGAEGRVERAARLEEGVAARVAAEDDGGERVLLERPLEGPGRVADRPDPFLDRSQDARAGDRGPREQQHARVGEAGPCIAAQLLRWELLRRSDPPLAAKQAGRLEQRRQRLPHLGDKDVRVDVRQVGVPAEQVADRGELSPRRTAGREGAEAVVGGQPWADGVAVGVLLHPLPPRPLRLGSLARLEGVVPVRLGHADVQVRARVLEVEAVAVQLRVDVVRDERELESAHLLRPRLQHLLGRPLALDTGVAVRGRPAAVCSGGTPPLR
mmetsp:Transcript_21749/g.66254  ORF Transcript_21749/g.66254 Transcript_21749/m.66254 type:complete len:271 (-) Transcript_21749:97-909(-)